MNHSFMDGFYIEDSIMVRIRVTEEKDGMFYAEYLHMWAWGKTPHEAGNRLQEIFLDEIMQTS